ncbi:MAG: hypothetical protein ABDH49_08055 [Candidatus Hydrothermales bacterium]
MKVKWVELKSSENNGNQSEISYKEFFDFEIDGRRFEYFLS